jgi:hypothetical protein
MPTPGGDGETDLLDSHGNRIQWAVLAAHHAETTRRSRQAMVELVRAGYQIGPPPYGYRALRIRVTDPTGHSKLRAVLVPDWQTAAVVKQIFTWRADHGLKFSVIADRLNRDPRQYPAPVPNGRWTAKAVRRVITNPKYVGRQVWARTVAGRPAPVEQWVTSAPKMHEPLVDERTFHRAQPRPAAPPTGTADAPPERGMNTHRWTPRRSGPVRRLRRGELGLNALAGGRRRGPGCTPSHRTESNCLRSAPRLHRRIQSTLDSMRIWREGRMSVTRGQCPSGRHRSAHLWTGLFLSAFLGQLEEIVGGAVQGRAQGGQRPDLHLARLFGHKVRYG